MELTDRTALITGAASGIGRATARRLAAEGVQLALVDRDPEGLAAIADELRAVAIAADASRSDEIDAAFATTVARLGRVDLAYLNAGIAIGIADLEELTDDDYHRIVDLNLGGVVFGARAAVRTMRRAGGGTIVATASLAGIVPFPPDPVYDATKHAVVGFVRSIAPGLAGDGIVVHAICPGLVDTKILPDETKDLITGAGYPLMQPEQIAEAVVVAARSDASGSCWVCQPGLDPVPYEFRDAPGPRLAGSDGVPPPGVRGDDPHIFRPGSA